MRKVRHGDWRWLIALVGASLTTAQTAERSVWKVGDTWKYHQKSGSPEVESDWSRKVVNTLPDGRLSVETEDGRKLTFDSDGNSLDARGKDYSWRRFDFPLSVGKRWTNERKIAGDTWNGNEQSSWEVKAQEKVTVPAGTFDCFRVEGVAWRHWSSGTVITQGYKVAQTETTYWFCPEVKWVAKWKTRTQSYRAGPFKDEESVLTSFVPGQ